MSTTTTDRTPTGGPGPSPAADPLGPLLAHDWWVIALRGLLAVLFGIIALAMPAATILALVLLFAAYMLVDGVFSLITAFRAMFRRDTRPDGRQEGWGLPLLQGVASIIAAAIAIFWPGITALAFVLVVGAWSIVTGSVMLSAAARVDRGHGSLWLAIGGVLSVLFGFLLILSPVIGAVVLTWWIGVYAIVLGAFLIVTSFRLRAHRREPPFGAPMPA